MTLSAACNCSVVMPWGKQRLGLATLGSCFSLPVQQSSLETNAFRLGIWRGRNYKSKFCTAACVAFTKWNWWPRNSQACHNSTLSTHFPASSFPSAPNLLSKTKQTPGHNSICWSKPSTSYTVALSRIPRVLSQSKAPINCASSEGTA